MTNFFYSITRTFAAMRRQRDSDSSLPIPTRMHVNSLYEFANLSRYR